MSIDKNVPKVQRALVLHGGGALGAYEAGALKCYLRFSEWKTKKMEKKTDYSLMSSQGHL
jgi:hypothetical protein